MNTWNGRLPQHPRATAQAHLTSGAWSTTPTARRFREIAAAHPHREAVVGLDRTFTYADLDTRSDQVAAALRARGLTTGDPVLVQVGNSAEAVLAWYGLLKAGAVPVATLAAHRSHEVLHISAIVGAVGHLVDTEVADGFLLEFAADIAAVTDTLRFTYRVGHAAQTPVPRIAELGLDVDPEAARAVVEAVQDQIGAEDVAVFQLSGGTTGTPKLIPRLHGEYWNNGLANSQVLQRDETSRIAHVLPFVHNAGMVNALFGAHSVGGCTLLPTFAPAERSLQWLIDARANDMMMAGPMVPWVDHPLWAQLAQSLRRLIFSGAKVPADLFDRVTALGTWMGQTWGMAEGPYTTTPVDAPSEARRNTIGVPVRRGDSFKVVSLDDGSEVPDGEVGLLTYRGPGTLAGYFDAEEHNAAAIRDDGYLDTGDLAKVVGHEGVRYLSMEGRMKDVISRGGEKFSTEEVEKLLSQHESILEAAVVAMPDELLGERACAYVVLAAGAEPPTIDDIRRHFTRLGVAKFKWPERLEQLQSLPRTNTTKVDKQRLRSEIAEKVSAEKNSAETVRA